MKSLSLLKAILSEDMNIFKYKSNGKYRFLLPIILYIILCFSIGSFIYYIGFSLAKYHLTIVLISIILMTTSIITLIEGISKSQSILFEGKDNDILFSLPIKKRSILFVRIIKLLLFEYLFNSIIFLPTFIVYIILENPNISFYFLAILIFLLIPIIPTIIASFIGYIIKLLTNNMKYKSVFQVILTFIFLIPILYFSFNSQNLINNIVVSADKINKIITSIYYPIDLSILLITKFNILDLIIFILINIIPFIIFIVIGQVFYFKIISNNKKIYKISNNIKIIVNKPIISLTKKELKRYFKSPVLMLNTLFGLILLLFFTIILCFKGKTLLVNLLSNYGINNNISTNMLFYGIICFSLSMTSITSSSISLEGKSINITKSLPIDYKVIFISKILNSFIIEFPFIILSILLYIICFSFNFLFIIELLLVSILIILLNGIIGLIINLKYPKLNYNNDTEVVKQSKSSIISVFCGFIIFILSILEFIFLYDILNLDILIGIHLCILLVVNIILYKLLIKNGINRYQRLNI